MDLEVSTTQIALALAAGIVGAGYIAFILIPAWESYDRVWEKVAASFLTLYMLATLAGVGGGIGLAIVWSYDRYAG
jgi:hypothetical protein